MRRLRKHINYANTIATIALFVALGGTSYATGIIPHNSVGSAQLRTHAVSSTKLAKSAVHLTNITAATRRALKGATGPRGTVGPAGTPAISYFAAVTAGGTVVRGSGADSHPTGGSGSYTLAFPINVSGCVYSATLGTTDATAPPIAHIGVRDDAGKVGIQITDNNGAPVDQPFHLIVAC
jgi:hypothetical protein